MYQGKPINYYSLLGFANKMAFLHHNIENIDCTASVIHFNIVKQKKKEKKIFGNK